MNRRNLQVAAFFLGHDVNILTGAGDYNTEDGSNSISVVEESNQLNSIGELTIKKVIATGRNMTCCESLRRGFDLVRYREREISERTHAGNEMHLSRLPRFLRCVGNNIRAEKDESTVEVRTRDSRVNNI